MNDLSINFSEKHQVSKVRQRLFTYVGIISCIIGILIAALHRETFIEGIASLFLFIFGLIAAIIVNPMIFKWARSFIHISNTDIEYQFWGIQRKTSVQWDSVKSLTMNFNEIYFELDNNTIIKLNLAFVSDSTIEKIKQSILGLSNEKGIFVSEKE